MKPDITILTSLTSLGIAILAFFHSINLRRDNLFARINERQLLILASIAGEIEAHMNNIIRSTSPEGVVAQLNAVPGALLGLHARGEAAALFPGGWFWALAKAQRAVEEALGGPELHSKEAITEAAADTYLALWSLAVDLGLVVGSREYIIHHWRLVRDLQGPAALHLVFGRRAFRRERRERIIAHLSQALQGSINPGLDPVVPQIAAERAATPDGIGSSRLGL